MTELEFAGDLRFAGDVSFTVDGTAGTVTGDGDTVRVHANDPVKVWDAALGSVSTGPAMLRSAARLLHDQGVRVEVSGPAGRLVLVGAGVSSPIGVVLTGSPHVRLGSPQAVRPLAVAQARRSLAGLLRDPTGAAVMVVLLWIATRGLRRR